MSPLLVFLASSGSIHTKKTCNLGRKTDAKTNQTGANIRKEAQTKIFASGVFQKPFQVASWFKLRCQHGP